VPESLIMNIVSGHLDSLRPTTQRRKRNLWRLEEDNYLKSRVPQVLSKSVDWVEIAQGLPNRNNKDCRKRWLKIDDKWERGSWSEDEDQRLVRAFNQFGNK
jgi:hypothetical protein